MEDGGWRGGQLYFSSPCENFDCSLLESCLASLILLALLNEFASLLIKLLGLLLEGVSPVVPQLGRPLLIAPAHIFMSKTIFEIKIVDRGN